MLLFKALIVWLVLVAAEIIHGILRGIFLQPRLGDLRARQIAVFTGSIIIIAIVTAFFPWLGCHSTSELAGIGCFWLFLMLTFEISFGRFILHLSWQRILSDYDVRNGGLLAFGMLALAASPLIAAAIHNCSS